MCKKRVATHNFLPCCDGANGDGDDGMKEEIQSDIMTGAGTATGNQVSHRQSRTKDPGHQGSSRRLSGNAGLKTQVISVAACPTQTTQD
jgi:hypothetical protein